MNHTWLFLPAPGSKQQNHHPTSILCPQSSISPSTTLNMSTFSLYRDFEDSEEYENESLPLRYLFGATDDDNHTGQTKEYLLEVVYGYVTPSQGAEDFDGITTNIADEKHAEWLQRPGKYKCRLAPNEQAAGVWMGYLVPDPRRHIVRYSIPFPVCARCTRRTTTARTGLLSS